MPRGGGAVLETDLDFPIQFSDLVRPLEWLAVDRLNSCFQFVLPAMPRTGHASVGDFAFRDRTTLMSTHSVDCKQAILMPENRQNVFAHNDFLWRCRCHGFTVGDGGPGFTHEIEYVL